MPARCLASILFSYSKRFCVQWTNPDQHGSFVMLLDGNSFSADLVSYCIQKCHEEAAATVWRLQQQCGGCSNSVEAAAIVS